MSIKKKKRRKNLPYFDLRSRLEEYSILKEQNRWKDYDEFEGEEGASSPSFLFSIWQDMHKFFLFKITMALLVILVVLLCTFWSVPLTAAILQKIQYVTAWEMDFLALGKEAVPAIRKLWEGDLEARLEQVVMAPGSNLYTAAELKFIAPVEGEVDKSFGLQFNPLQQKEEMFYGLLFRAARGSFVRASASGRVKEISEDPVFGLGLLLQHYSTGMESFYGYLGETLVREGEEVKGGQIIARTGLLPLERTPALYFEIRQNGEPVDPLPLLLAGGS